MNASEATIERVFGPASGRQPASIRRAVRAGAWSSHTTGIAPYCVQGNVVILPRTYAPDFLRFCVENSKPCPVLGVSEPGSPLLPSLGADLDIRTDVPRYRVFRHGELVSEPADIVDLWRDDLVAFVLGCSFSFEQALLDAGVPLRHIALGKNVSMYETNVETTRSGPFGGPLVVSMRPVRGREVVRAVQVTARFPKAHGAPVHVGEPVELGIRDLARPDYGEAVAVLPGELPMFWACGVTALVAVERARPELCITHAPGAMLVTDLDGRFPWDA